MFHRFIVTALAVGAACFLTLAGCANRNDSPSDAESAGASGNAQAEPSEVVVYTYDAFPSALEDLLVSHFGDQGTTVIVERFEDTGGLFAELLLTRDESPVDVVIGLDTTYLGHAIREELFQPYTPEALAGIPEDFVVDPLHRLVPFDYGNVVLNYDSELLPEPPATWEELTAPDLANSIVLTNPATSSPGRNFLLLTVMLFGEEGYLDFWERLRPNVLTVTAGWSEAYGLYTQGEAPIVLSYETSPVYHIAFEETDRYRNLVIEDAGYTQIELAGITAHSDNVAGARGVIEFVLSEQFQSEIPLNQFMYPVRVDVETPEAFAAVDRPSTVRYMSSERIEENFDEWLAAWEEVMRQ